MTVWSIGYDAASSAWKRGGALSLPDRAANILPRLVNERALQSGDIYFVTHSLGGLVVKSLLRAAEARAPHSAETESFLQRVRKVVFIGTPHAGSDQASLAKQLWFAILPRQTTKGLGRNDPHLRDLNKWFRSYFVTNKLDALVLNETRRLSYFGIPGLAGIIVKPDSADPGLPPDVEVIPIDADHLGIVAPSGRNSDVYQHVLTFLSKPPTGRSRGDLLKDAIEEVEASVEQHSELLYLQLNNARDDIISSITSKHHDHLKDLSILSASGPRRESAVVTRELQGRIWSLRRSRFFAVKEALNDARSLVVEMGQGGELEAASAEARRVAYAWCARLLAAEDVGAAEEALRLANSLGSGDENSIAAAFIAAFKSGAAAGLALLGGLRTPEANSAAFMIASVKTDPTDALKWLSDAGLELSDLDSDGRLSVLQRRLAARDWEGALKDIELINEDDFDKSPALYYNVALAHLIAAVPGDLRGNVVDQFPFLIEDIHLNATPEALRHRELARTFFSKSCVKFTELKHTRSANMSADCELWLSLQDEATKEAARGILAQSMSDPVHRLRRLPMAIRAGLKLDLETVELELEREATRTGEKSVDLALARYAMARAQAGPAEVASYIERYRKQIIECIEPSWIRAIEIDALAHSDQLEKAKDALRELEAEKNIPHVMLVSLRRTIDEASGGDHISIYEAQYLENGRFLDLVNLFTVLKERRIWKKIVVYGKELFEQTRQPQYGIAYAEALYWTDNYADLDKLADDYPSLADTPEFKHIEAWAKYSVGDVVQAKRLLERSRAESDPISSVSLERNIAISSGDWHLLGTFVEDQWARREELSASDLLRAGILAQHINSSRDQELITEAAHKANKDAAILVGCYSAAFAAGWESKSEIQDWFRAAIENSGDDGPVKPFEFRQLADMAPDWRKRESDVWDHLLKGELPMYAGASLLNRPPVEMFTMSALSNMDELDLRKRGVVFAYSGTRPVIELDAKRPAFDVTALLNLAFIGQLSNAFKLFERVFLSHRTMGWLFEQRYAVRFHQPSRIKDAEEVRRLVDSGSIISFEPTQPPNVGLEAEVGRDLAEMLVAALAGNSIIHRSHFVIRSFPVHKPNSWMEELSNIGGFESVIADCSSLVTALRQLGYITESEETRAKSYLSAHEQAWPHEITPIPAGAELYLDDLAVTFLQHVGILGKLRAAGFKTYVAATEIARTDALLQQRLYSEAAGALIEDIRTAVLDGINSGHILLGPQSAGESSDDVRKSDEEPSVGLFTISAADAFIIDDRFLNQHAFVDLSDGPRRVFTTLDIYEALRVRRVIDDAQFGEILTRLRIAGYLLVPILPTELNAAIVRAQILEGKLQETAELRAIRESNLRVQMLDVVQLPKEAQWLDGNLRVVLQCLQRQWMPDLPDSVARARSNWLLTLLDVSCWAHRFPPDSPLAEERRSALVLMLSHAPTDEKSVRKRYEAWFEEAILIPTKELEPRVYAKVLQTARAVVEACVNDIDAAVEGGADE